MAAAFDASAASLSAESTLTSDTLVATVPWKEPRIGETSHRRQTPMRFFCCENSRLWLLALDKIVRGGALMTKIARLEALGVADACEARKEYVTKAGGSPKLWIAWIYRTEEPPMKLHPNARLTPRVRETLVSRVTADVAHAGRQQRVGTKQLEERS